MPAVSGRHDVPWQKHLIDLRKAPPVVDAVENPHEIEALCRPFIGDARQVAGYFPRYAGDWGVWPAKEGHA